MRWNLRLTAANRGIWKASELQRMLAERGLVVSAGKMSGLWSGEPASIKLTDLDVICVVLGCGVEELLIPQPKTVTRIDERHDPARRGFRGGNGGGDAQAPRRALAATGLTCPRARSFPASAAAWTVWPGEWWEPVAARRAPCSATITPAVMATAPDAVGSSR
ncbi:MAG: helix-turn-helix domain-containing protein [Pseudonocardiaceae bacterium]